METQTKPLTIQAAAAATGLSEHTLRYYERIGLIHPIDRAANTHRRYDEGDLGWIDFLTKLRATGMPIKQMLAYAELARQGDATLPERLELLKAHQRMVEDHLAALGEHLRVIRHKVEYYAGVLAAQNPAPK